MNSPDHLQFVRRFAAALDRVFPDEPLRETFPTVRHALTQVLLCHASYHVGQLAAWRKVAGLSPIGRAFE